MSKNDEVTEPFGFRGYKFAVSSISSIFAFFCGECIHEAAGFLARCCRSLVCAGGHAVCNPHTDIKSKFYHAVAVLPQEVVSQILDLICAPPTGDPYIVLQECLRMLYMPNDYQCFEALVSLPLSGDQKPLHLMNRIPSSWWLQTELHPQGVVSPMPPYRCTFSFTLWEGIRS